MKKLIAFFVAAVVLLFSPSKILASGTPSQSNSSYKGPSNSLPADGSTTGTITIYLKDSNNNPVAYDTLKLSSSNDSTAIFNNNQTTGADGSANFTISSTTAGTTEVTMTDSTAGITFTNWFAVTFYSATVNCSNVPAAPVLNSVVSNSSGAVILSWTDSANPVSNYVVSYGIASGSYIYGNPNVGGQGTTTTTISGLTANKKYYFVVAANNACGISSFSNEVSAVASPATPTPVATITPTVAPLISTLATSEPTETPEEVTETPSPTPEASTGSPNTLMRDIAIGIIALGVILLLGIVLIAKKGKKKGPGGFQKIDTNSTPQNSPQNWPQNQSDNPSSQPPTYNPPTNFPPQTPLQ
ncbi:MAG: Ig-like domain-containing protein [Candidatus Microgenomates bacterium]|jgi:hypothetical protein